MSPVNLYRLATCVDRQSVSPVNLYRPSTFFGRQFERMKRRQVARFAWNSARELERLGHELLTGESGPPRERQIAEQRSPLRAERRAAS
ncbi:MAG TPA: hypothetical protein VL242_20490 [Sorangium sp.]|nr:hypothetical protein [Sorangium sp.]